MEANLPLESEEDSLTNERASLGVSGGPWVMVVTQCPHPSFDLVPD